MAKHAIRAVRPWRSSAIRRLCSATAADMHPPPPPPAAPAPAPAPTPTPTPTADWKPLYRRLSALSNAPDGSVAEVLGQWVFKERRKVDAAHLMRHVRELRKFGRFRHALEMMDWMQTSGLQMPNGSHAVKLDLISKINGVDSAEKYFSGLPDSVKYYGAYVALLSCYCKHNMVEKATVLYEMMKELSLASNSLTYNNLMSLYLKVGQLEKVLTLFQEMKENNIFRDNCTYRIVMNCYASMNDMDTVEKLLQEMEANQGSLDWFTYCHFASLCNSAGLFDRTMIFLKKAELVLRSRDLSPFRFLISLYAGAGNLDEVKRVWNLLKAKVPRPHNKNPRPSNMCYLVMLQALKKLDAMDALKQCFEEWEAGCFFYDIKTANTVISAYLEKDMLEEAELLQETAAKKGAQSDIHTFALFIAYYLKIGDLELAQKCAVAATSMLKRGFLW